MHTSYVHLFVLIRCLIVQCTVMDNLKLINDQHAKTIYAYQNRKEELHRANAAIWFSKMCRLKRPTPKYIQITLNAYS